LKTDATLVSEKRFITTTLVHIANPVVSRGVTPALERSEGPHRRLQSA
jgi:hypothetical protein